MTGARRLPATPGTYVMVVRITARILGVAAVGLGLVLIFGGPARFSGPSYATARAVPGGHLTWGAAAAALGVLMLTASLRRLWGALTVAQAGFGVWCLFFAAGSAVAAFHDPRAGLTGSVVYTAVGLVLIVQAVGLRAGRTS